MRNPNSLILFFSGASLLAGCAGPAPDHGIVSTQSDINAIDVSCSPGPGDADPIRSGHGAAIFTGRVTLQGSEPNGVSVYGGQLNVTLFQGLDANGNPSEPFDLSGDYQGEFYTAEELHAEGDRLALFGGPFEGLGLAIDNHPSADATGGGEAYIRQLKIFEYATHCRPIVIRRR